MLWQKDGGTVRRGKVVVPAVHAYRTRAYLVMRKEYVGRWTVRNRRLLQPLQGLIRNQQLAPLQPLQSLQISRMQQMQRLQQGMGPKIERMPQRRRTG